MTALLSRIWPHLLAAAAILGFIAYVDHRGYARAQADRAEQDRRTASIVAKAVEEIDRENAARLASIDKTQRTVVQPIITKEIAGDPRYSDPACSLTDGMRDAINAARATSAPPGGGGVTVPGSPPTH